jgi:hypothetical protein
MAKTSGEGDAQSNVDGKGRDKSLKTIEQVRSQGEVGEVHGTHRRGEVERM